MASRRYQRENLTLIRPIRGRARRSLTDDDGAVRDLQRDLRCLGYLRSSIDGKFGTGTERAIQALQYDLLTNAGRSERGDGDAPVSVLDYNKGRVVDVTGVVDQDFAACVADMVEDDGFPKLPYSENPTEENAKIRATIAAMQPDLVPIPFLMAIVQQEASFQHFRVPRQGDDDSYIVVGLDINAGQDYIITSRGYGVGQYTLFHHPPRPEEVRDVMLDPQKNLDKAIHELRDKFDHFVNGATSGSRADDRLAEYGDGPLRVCKYAADDSRYLRDCAQCLRDAGSVDIEMGVTPYYEGSDHLFEKTTYYKKSVYPHVPVRNAIGCDWPYAVRRYNGAGVNSYHYQTLILLHILEL